MYTWNNEIKAKRGKANIPPMHYLSIKLYSNVPPPPGGGVYKCNLVTPYSILVTQVHA